MLSAWPARWQRARRGTLWSCSVACAWPGAVPSSASSANSACFAWTPPSGDRKQLVVALEFQHGYNSSRPRTLAAPPFVWILVPCAPWRVRCREASDLFWR